MYDGATETQLLARSPGYAPRPHGETSGMDGLLASNQADLNAMCGLLAGEANNLYPNVSIELGQNNRFIDVCPAQYITLTIDAADSGQRVSWTNQKLIPRSVQLNLDFANDNLVTSIDCAAETFPENAVTVPIWAPQEYNFYDLPTAVGFALAPLGNLTFPTLVTPDNDGIYRGPGYNCMRDTTLASGVAIEPYLDLIATVAEYEDWKVYTWPAGIGFVNNGINGSFALPIGGVSVKHVKGVGIRKTGGTPESQASIDGFLAHYEDHGTWIGLTEVANPLNYHPHFTLLFTGPDLNEIELPLTVSTETFMDGLWHFDGLTNFNLPLSTYGTDWRLRFDSADAGVDACCFTSISFMGACA
jgi:hypothetical protein